MNRFTHWLTFNLWYFRRPPWDTGISPPELLEFMASHPAGRALDLGCGTGTNVLCLARSGWQVTGVDFAPRAIRAARRKAEAAHLQVDLRLGSVTNLHELRGFYDLALDIGCYHGLGARDREAYRRNAARLLARGGNLLVYARIKDEKGPNGIDEGDLAAFFPPFRLARRQDSLDRRGRPATWITLERQA